ncbi:MAG: hypothetical protein R3E79_11345 [Caldilineaceae bacterium]
MATTPPNPTATSANMYRGIASAGGDQRLDRPLQLDQRRDGGYLRACTEGRNWFETDFPNWLKQDPPVISADKRSEEHGSYIIEALETGRIYRGHFNLPNQGHHQPAG